MNNLARLFLSPLSTPFLVQMCDSQNPNAFVSRMTGPINLEPTELQTNETLKPAFHPN